MIRYALKCENDHRFESWFQSAQAYDKLAASGLVTCAICGSASVEKAMMAPRVRPARDSATAEETTPAVSASDEEKTPESAAQTAPLSGHDSELERSMSQLRDKIEENSDYVGTNFAKEARAMHHGDSPSRAIHGEAKLSEAKELIEDGVPIVPLPFMPKKQVN